MIRRPPRSTRTDPLFPYTTLFRSATGLPSIGVAKKILVGSGSEPHQMRGAYTPLRHNRAQLGWILRSKVNCNPLVVSPGHRVSMASAADLVMRFTGKYRMPEPTRLADRLTSLPATDPRDTLRPRTPAGTSRPHQN